MCCIQKKPDYFCKIYSALELGSSIQTSIRNGWIFFMSDCFLFSNRVYAYTRNSAADAQRCRLFTYSYSNDWTCSNGSNHLKTKCCLFSSLVKKEHQYSHRYGGYIYILITRQTSKKIDSALQIGTTHIYTINDILLRLYLIII